LKQITEIDDARLVKGLAHPIRIHILRVLQNRLASPSEIAEEIGAPLGNVSYHVRFLVRMGLIELATTKPRRGAVEHYYRAVGRVLVSEQAWAQVPQIVKNTLLGSSLEQIARAISDAAASGGFDRDDALVSRQSVRLDARGFSEVAAELARFLDRCSAIESDSIERLASADGAGRRRPIEITADLVTMLFESPESGPTASADNHPAPAARSRRPRARK